MSRTALALDVEPNDDASTAEPIGGNVFARGALNESSDPIDVYTFTATGDGTFTARLSDYAVNSSEFSLELWDEDEVVLEAASDDGTGSLRLDHALDEGQQYFLVVQTAAGSGRYHLWSGTAFDAPALSGLSSSDPDPGDSLTITGAGFGTDPDRVSVWVGEVQAEVVSVAETSISVTVPGRSVDGSVMVIKDRKSSNTLALTISGGTAGPPAGFEYDAPDAASLVASGPGQFYFDRMIVSFTGSTSDTEGEAVLDDALSAVPLLDGWTRVGLSPATNSWQVVLDWDSTATVADWEDLADVLEAELSVDEVSAQVPVSVAAGGFGPGQDVNTSWSTVQHHYAAFDMVAMEEAWRLFAGTSATLEPGVPDVVVIDSGLLPASPAGIVTRHSVNDSRFSMFGIPPGGSGWEWQAESAWFDGQESCETGSVSHGTGIAGIIGGLNNGEPRWDGGADRGLGSMGVSGVLGGLQQWGVDDDGDGTVDEAGESIVYDVTVFGTYSVKGSGGPGCDLQSEGLKNVLSHLVTLELPPDILNLSVGYRALAPDVFPVTIAGQLSDDILFTVAAGNPSDPSDTAYKANQLAADVNTFGLTHLVVSGADPNPGAIDADTRAIWGGGFAARSGINASVDIAAPAQVLSVRATSATSAAIGPSWGTSNSTALVSGVAAMLKAASPDLRGPDLAGIIQGTATPITGLWNPPEPMVRLDAAAALAFVLSRDGTLDHTVRVYAGDYSSQRIWYQTYDQEARQFTGGADYYDATGECQPVDLKVDARGDLVYALCRNSTSAASVLILAHGPLGTLSKVGQYTLPGAVDLYTEMVTTPEGYVVLATDASAGSGAASYTVLDSFDGSVVAVDESLFASGVVELEGASAHSTGQQVYFTANDNDSTVGGDQLAILDLDAYRRSAGGLAITSGDYASAGSPVQVRDVAFDPVDELPISLFYHSSSSVELVWNDTDGSFFIDDELDYIDNGNTLSLNPSSEDRLGYLGSLASGTPWFTMVDVTDSPWTPLAVIAPPSGLTSPVAAFSAFSDTGRSVVLGWRASGTGARVYIVPHDPSLSSTTSSPTSVTAIADFDGMGASISSLRGVAMTPSISVLSPRPGKELSGVRRLIVQVRDPNVEYLSFRVDEAAVSTCPDDHSLADGISDSCLLSAMGWSGPSDHVVEITAHFTDGASAVTRVRY